MRHQRQKDNRRKNETLYKISRFLNDQQTRDLSAQNTTKGSHLSAKGINLTERSTPRTAELSVAPVQKLKNDLETADQTTTDDMVVGQTQKYKDWRVSHPSGNITMNGSLPIKPVRYVLRPRANTTNTRYTLPARVSTGYERGRSLHRTLVHTDGKYDGNYVMMRSKSAPAVNRQSSTQVRQPLYFTKSHYMAIKQPFSKKYLLPPVRTFYEERPVTQTLPRPQTQRSVIEVRRTPAPAPPKPITSKGNVYHVQFVPSANQTIHRLGGELGLELNSSRPYTVQSTREWHTKSENTPRVIHSGQSNVFTYDDSGGQSNVYTVGSSEAQGRYYTIDKPDQTIGETRIYESRYGHGPTRIQLKTSDQAHHGTSVKTGVRMAEWTGDDLHVEKLHLENVQADDTSYPYRASYREHVTTVSTQGSRKAADEFTIIDYVEQNKPATNHVVRYSGHDSSALHDLDKVLNMPSESEHSSPGRKKNSSSSSSSSSLSSSAPSRTRSK